MGKQIWHYTGDVNTLDYGGRWFRHIIGTGSRYHVVRLDPNPDYSPGDEHHPPYFCDLHEVDIANATQLANARESCQWDGFPEPGDEHYGLACAEAMSSYGAYAPLGQDAGSNGWDLVRAHKRLSRELEGDPHEYDVRMSRQVNALGQSAREYAGGNMDSAIMRGLDAGDAKAGIVATMYQAAGATLGGGPLPVCSTCDKPTLPGGTCPSESCR